nr:hypothetical protein WS66_10355 [Burkholderia sp. LA-2-3-30-S1-D2]
MRRARIARNDAQRREQVLLHASHQAGRERMSTYIDPMCINLAGLAHRAFQSANKGHRLMCRVIVQAHVAFQV